MESTELVDLKEWSVLEDLMKKLPTRIQKGIFYHDLNITCIDVVLEFIAIGTDAGVVLWYNRKNGHLQKLRCESSHKITCIKIVSSVEFMVAAGSDSGEISVFQIQKEHPPDLNLEPLTKPKPIERYTIKNMHRSSLSCVEWSKNGMKLFSGDKLGVIVLTEFDYHLHISKSIEILNEAYDVVQIAFTQPWLLISTVYRAIVCEQNCNGKWKVSQIGKKDRKVLSEFGACFTGSSRKPTILCSRPGFRFWISDTNGNVSQTLLFKDALKKPSCEIPLLNPGRLPIELPVNFGRFLIYKQNYILTWSDNILYVLNIDKITVVATVRRLRGILGLAVCESDIFVIEGPRSIIRLSTNIDTRNYNSDFIIFNPTIQYNRREFMSFMEPTIETDEEAIVNAEECFELPPIEELVLDIPVQLTTDSFQDKLYFDHSKKIEIYDKINSIQYDNSILFKSGILNKKHSDKKVKSTTKTKKIDKNKGVVEIGQQAFVSSVNENKIIHSEESNNEYSTTKPTVLNISFCGSTGFVPDIRSPETIKRDIEIKEKILAETLNIQPVSLEKLATPIETPDKILPKWINSIENITSMPTSASNNSQLKKLHFIEDESPTSDDDKLKDKMNNLSDDFKNIMIKSNITDYNTLYRTDNVPSTSSSSFYGTKSPVSIPDLRTMPAYMKIPNLWNASIEVPDQIENIDFSINSNSKNDSHSEGSDWEIV